MPKAGKTALCHCRLYCTTYNEITKCYEGPGNRIPQSTKYNHMRDSRRLGSSVMAIPSIPEMVRERATEIDAVWAEFQYLSSWAVLSATMPLNFTKNPLQIGPYERPAYQDFFNANSGIYALNSQSQGNESFLSAENSYCNLVTRLRSLQPGIERDFAINSIENEIIYINRLKGLEWDRQRMTNTAGISVVNTGMSLLLRFNIK